MVTLLQTPGDYTQYIYNYIYMIMINNGLRYLIMDIVTINNYGPQFHNQILYLLSIVWVFFHQITSLKGRHKWRHGEMSMSRQIALAMIQPLQDDHIFQVVSYVHNMCKYMQFWGKYMISYVGMSAYMYTQIELQMGV